MPGVSLKCRECKTDMRVTTKEKVRSYIDCPQCRTRHPVFACSECFSLLALPNLDNELSASVKCTRRGCGKLNMI